MNADRLLELYEQISEAPDAIARLRRFVLDLAIRGKLVQQNTPDEPAAKLLEAIAIEQAELVKSGKIKKPKALPPVDLAMAPFELPNGWEWARFSELGKFGRGKSKHRPRNDPALYRDGKVPFVQTGDVARSGGRITSHKGFYNEVGLAQSMLWPRGTMCITIAANIADSGILEFDACFPDSVVGLVPASMFESARYFEYFIRTAKANLLEFAPATAQKNINLGILETVLIPLPPLAEQHRIVAKVDELMALCDRLEEARKTREETRDKLTAATLARLTAPEATAASETDGTNAPSGAAPNQAEQENGETGPVSGAATAQPSDFSTYAHFAIETLPALTSRPDQINPLRQTILNLAVRGKLVEQDPADEPASDLVRKIGLRTNPSTTLTASPLPTGWVWARIDELATVGTGVTPSKSEPAYHVNGTIPWVNSAATNSPVIHSVDTFVTERAVKECRLKIYPAGSLVVALYGQGKTRGQAAELRIAATVNQACAVIQFVEGFEGIRPFLHLSLKKQYEEMRSLAEGGAQPNLNLGKIKSKYLPLPPLEEQHRIVAKVDALMALCDQLEAALTSADATRTRLLEALLHEALEPAGQALEAAE